ncbi:MAG: L-serine ammonia-lyase, iron-sulfur-dependent, subunit alpha [Rubripirellula sp.]
MLVSIFNDVVGPVMRGPSSSHCAAALRIGRVSRDLMGGAIDHVLVQFDNGGSLPATHQSQGSDMGLFGGLLGWEADDDRLPASGEWLKKSGIDLQFEYGDYGDPHPNTYRLSLSNSERQLQVIAISTGGGMFEIVEINGAAVSIGGDFDETLVWSSARLAELDSQTLCDELGADQVAISAGSDSTGNDLTLIHIQAQHGIPVERIGAVIPGDAIRQVDHATAVLPVRSRKELKVPFQTCNAMLQYADRYREENNLGSLSLSDLALHYESTRSGLGEAELIEKMCNIVRILRTSVDQGLAGTSYEDRVLGFQSGGYQKAMEEGRLLDGGILNRMVLYTSALMEVKSSMGVIVAAPTAGACAAFPAACLAIGESQQLSDGEIAKGMLAGGMVGVFIATHWSFAAEVGGCQAEGGSASAMSAAALVTFMGGDAAMACGAASMSMQNMLGLICDPVANRVEVPCLGKNVLAVSNALSAANMSLAGFDAVIPLDETIAAAKAVAERMPREHRCTALGGLAITPTSLAIQKRLEGCGNCGC